MIWSGLAGFTEQDARKRGIRTKERVANGHGERETNRHVSDDGPD